MGVLCNSMKIIMSMMILFIFAICTFLPLASGQMFEENFMIVFPSFTDTSATENWRSWICITNPWIVPANAAIYIYGQNGNYLGEQHITLNPAASYFVRPRNIVGYDCSGSALVLSDIPLIGILEKTRNNNQMTSAYNGLIFDLRVRDESSSLSWSAVPMRGRS